MYHISLAGGAAAASGMGALAIPSSGSPVLQGAHQALAFTGFAFGAYVLLAVVLILCGLILRKVSSYTGRVAARDQAGDR